MSDDLDDVDLDEFEALGRRAGAELRVAAPTDGPLVAQHTARRRRTTKLVGGAGVVVALLVGGLWALTRDSTESPVIDQNTTTTAAPATTSSVALPTTTATAPARLALTGHTGIVVALDASIAGDEIATAGDDGTVRVWSSITGEELMQVDIGAATPVDAVALSADGAQVAAHLSDGTERFWDVPGATAANPFPVPWDDPAWEPFAPSRLESPDGRLRVELRGLSGGAVVGVASGQDLETLSGTGRAYNAAWSNDGTLFAVKFDREVKIHRADSLALVQEIATPEYEATADLLEFMVGDDRIAFTVENVVYVEPVDPIEPDQATTTTSS